MKISTILFVCEYILIYGNVGEGLDQDALLIPVTFKNISENYN